MSPNSDNNLPRRKAEREAEQAVKGKRSEAREMLEQYAPFLLWREA